MNRENIIRRGEAFKAIDACAKSLLNDKLRELGQPGDSTPTDISYGDNRRGYVSTFWDAAGTECTVVEVLFAWENRLVEGEYEVAWDSTQPQIIVH